MDKKLFFEMNDTNISLLQEYINENLLNKDEAALVTGQSQEAFDQSVKIGKVKPFFEKKKNGRSQYKLYLKKDLIEYKKTKRNINKNKK